MMMIQKTDFCFNTHRTYQNQISACLIKKLSAKRKVVYYDDEFIVYNSQNQKIVIDSTLSVYISNEFKENTFNADFENAKLEYSFLCSLESKFDTNSSVEITVPAILKKPHELPYPTLNLDDVLYMTTS